MKKIIYAALATVSSVVLLFSYRTSLDAVAAAPEPESPTATATPDSAPTASPAPSAATPSASATPSATPSTSAAAASGLTDGTYTGDAVDTRYGPVQVSITISGGTISAVTVPQYPTESRRDQEINQQAVPALIAETTGGTTAQVSMISGATYTSDGYQQSLQSALDQAQK